VTVSLEALVPADNVYRHLDARLDLSFVRAWVQDCYAAGGRPSIDPVVFFKLQLMLFFEGLRSERKLMDTVALHLAHRWYLGYHLDEPLPHLSSLTRIRARRGLPVFERFLVHVVELCQQAGLVWGNELFFDGTKVRANADYDSLLPRWYVAATAHLDTLFGETAALPEPPETGANPPPRLPFAGPVEWERQVAVTSERAWRLLDERRLDPTRPPSGPYRRITDFRVSTTDPDAAPLRSNAPPRLGYHNHYVVDGGRARVILAALVTPADVQDNQVMSDLLDRVRFRYHLHIRHAVGDSE
jgi:transposase